MIISKFDIEQRRKDFDQKQRGTDGPLTLNTVNIIGHVTMFFFIIRNDNGEEAFGTATALMLGITPPEDREEAPFKVDLAIPIHIPGLYAEVLDETVYSVVIPDPDGIPQNGICRVSDAEVIRAIVEKRNQSAKKPGLQLVVNNPDKQSL